MNLVAGEARQLASRAGDDHLRLPVLQGCECPVPDGEQLVVGIHLAGSTRTLRKRQGAEPWPTCISCDGCPLPQLTTPITCNSAGPAPASHAPQTSAVCPL